MSYQRWRYGRYVDANAMALYHGDTKVLQLDKGTANLIKIYGGDTTGDDIRIYANTVDAYPQIQLIGNGGIYYKGNTTSKHLFYSGTTQGVQIGPTGEIFLLETSTPSAVANYGAIYTKNDNNLYFQDGAGVEHTVQFA
jgi:hypothetical protein